MQQPWLMRYAAGPRTAFLLFTLVGCVMMHQIVQREGASVTHSLGRVMAPGLLGESVIVGP